VAAGQLTTLSAAPSAAVLDDTDIRPGSATSLLRTIIGCYLRHLGGWIASAALMELMTTAGVNPTRTRTAILRVRSKGILTTEIRDGRAGYALEPAALPRLARGDRRIYSPRAMSVSDRWCLISYSIPESQRQLRHQLRRRLSWIGCGTVSAALWICPEYLTSEVEDILTDLGIREEAVIFLASESRLDGGLDTAVARWWDLPAIAARHQAFLSGYGSVVDNLTPRQAFATWMGCLDVWRVIPYVDPGLPLAWLPVDWPGNRSIPLFADLRERLEDPSGRYVRRLTC
jgi:phenylacetic acid degradation operon negative regulatory protein